MNLIIHSSDTHGNLSSHFSLRSWALCEEMLALRESGHDWAWGLRRPGPKRRYTARPPGHLTLGDWKSKLTETEFVKHCPACGNWTLLSLFVYKTCTSLLCLLAWHNCRNSVNFHRPASSCIIVQILRIHKFGFDNPPWTRASRRLNFILARVEQPVRCLTLLYDHLK